MALNSIEPMVVFKDAKRETSAMKKEFRRRHAVVCSSKNAACMTLLICNENTSLAIDLGVDTNRLKIYSHAMLLYM